MCCCEFDKMERAEPGSLTPDSTLTTTTMFEAWHVMATRYPIAEGVTFKDIDGFPAYCVGDNGSVWSAKSGEWRKLTPVLRRGYERVGLWRSSRLEWRSVHHLVLEAFVGLRPDGTEACHFPDPDKTNNRLANLRWDTPKANAGDSVALGRMSHGSGHRCAKLAEADIPTVRRLLSEGVSRREIGRRFGVSHAVVNEVAWGTTWKHVP